MKTRKLVLLLAGLLAIVMALVACGSYAADAQPAPAAPAMQQAPAPAQPAARATAAPEAMSAPQSGAEIARSLRPQAPAAPAAAPTVAPAAASAQVVVKEVEFEVEAQSKEGSLDVEFSEERAALVAQNRIIVRTVHIELEVDDVAESIEEIAQGAQRDGGWVVNTDRSSKHIGFISVRVPAAKLDDVLNWMRAVGVDVLSEASTSTDVTDEYYDLRSRVESMQATEEALTRLLDRAEKVEEALEVQRELARLQVEIEAHLGRIKLLEETAAFSLVNVTLHLAPQDMRVDAGEDMTFSVGEVARFRATFYPPEGIDNFDFVWDFGDGTPVSAGNSSALRADGGRITATVHHQYRSDLESPFIVEVKMTGRGEAGVVEGSDTFIATVTELPAITVFAGEHMVVEEGEEVEFSGSFTRPEGLTTYRYSWEFSDGTEAIAGAPEEGATTVTAVHVYENHRPQPFTVTLTVTAESEAGNVDGSSSIEVFVQEAEGFVVSGWSAWDNLKDAVRALSGLAQAVGTLAIWVLIFIPVWIIIGLVIYLIVRSRRRLRLGRRRRARSESGVNEGYLSSVQDGDAAEQR